MKSCLLRPYEEGEDGGSACGERLSWGTRLGEKPDGLLNVVIEREKSMGNVRRSSKRVWKNKSAG